MEQNKKEDKEKVKQELTQEAKELLEKSQISIWLDTYDDIFSDFDPRPFSVRALSDDLLVEAKKAVREKKEALELRFLIPQAERKPEQEAIIKKRLHEHFRKHRNILEKEIKGTIRKGIFLAFFGFVLMAAATFLAYTQKKMLSTFLRVLFEPAGWFSIWFGLEQIFYKAGEKKPDLEFYKKMSKVEITFSSL